MKKFALVLFLMLISLAYKGRAQNEGNQPPAKLNFKVIASENNTWGYDIYRDGKLFVHQPNIPGAPGNSGFKDRIAAETIAKEVIKKIKKGEMPPTITVEEMKKLKAI